MFGTLSSYGKGVFVQKQKHHTVYTMYTVCILGCTVSER